MPSITVTVNLNKVEGAEVVNHPDGRNGIFIPSSALFCPIDRRTNTPTGNYILSLDIVDVPETKWHKTKIVKQHISNDRWMRMTDEEKNSVPIIGNGR